MILVAALVIAVSAVDRLIHPQGLDDVGIGLAISVGASAINLGVGLLLLRTGREQRSIVLEADGKHLLTDVWTSVGVVIGVAAVAISGWERLDAIVAIAVAVNILAAGGGLVRRSIGGLMDRSLGAPEQGQIDRVLAGFEARGIVFHALRTRQAGSRAFVSMHVLVPGEWTVKAGHDLAVEVEAAIHEELPFAVVFTHLEPVEDPASFEDIGLDPASGRRPPGG
jgi:cation diffusion facilitator family transporter